jgi:hypothetical protein
LFEETCVCAKAVLDMFKAGTNDGTTPHHAMALLAPGKGKTVLALVSFAGLALGTLGALRGLVVYTSPFIALTSSLAESLRGAMRPGVLDKSVYVIEFANVMNTTTMTMTREYLEHAMVVVVVTVDRLRAAPVTRLVRQAQAMGCCYLGVVADEFQHLST